MQVDVVELGDAVDFLDSKRVPVREELRKPGPYPYYGANGQQGRIDGYIFDEPLVLLAEDGGHFGSKEKPIAYYVEGKCWVNNHAHVMRTKQGCDPHYLHRILSFYDVSPYVTGSTRPKLTKGNAESIKIPLPPLSEQKLRAEMLEKADWLRRTRRYARQLSDTFLQSVFLEMFGDPMVNPHEWPILPLEELLAIPAHIGTTVPAGDVGEQLCVRVGEVGGWYVDLLSCKRVTLAGRALERFTVLPGDVVLARAIGSEEHLGKLSMLGPTCAPVVFDSHLMRLRPDKSKIKTSYLTTLLHTKQGRSLFMRQARRTAVQFNINTEQISELRLPIPPLPLQQKFTDIVRRFERLRGQQREAERQAEHLFQTLLHRAFADRLVTNTVPE
jgi:type I restriction enzyme, S subunit